MLKYLFLLAILPAVAAGVEIKEESSRSWQITGDNYIEKYTCTMQVLIDEKLDKQIRQSTCISERAEVIMPKKREPRSQEQIY